MSLFPTLQKLKVVTWRGDLVFSVFGMDHLEICQG